MRKTTYETLCEVFKGGTGQDVTWREMLRAIADQIDDARIKSPNFGRPVTVRDTDRVTKQPRFRKGRFQFYGSRWNFKDKCTESVAFVEMEDGQVIVKMPGSIQFTDRQS